MGISADDAERMGLLDRIQRCTCAVLDAAKRPCPWCRRTLTRVAPPVPMASPREPEPAQKRRASPEFDEQVQVAAALRGAGILFCASLGGMKLTAAQAGKAKAAGYEAGEPDLCIYDPPPALPGCVGTMVEMKAPGRRTRAADADALAGARPEQRGRMEALAAIGWHCVVAFGADDALQRLRLAGYGV